MDINNLNDADCYTESYDSTTDDTCVLAEVDIYGETYVSYTQEHGIQFDESYDEYY
jgi:hypothetical protein